MAFRVGSQYDSGQSAHFAPAAAAPGRPRGESPRDLEALELAAFLHAVHGGHCWPRDPSGSVRRTLPWADSGVRFEEIAGHVRLPERDHTMVELSPRFENIMPWLGRSGPAVAAADYDRRRLDRPLRHELRVAARHNRLFHDRGGGSFEDVAARAGVGLRQSRGRRDARGVRRRRTATGVPISTWSSGRRANQLFLNRGDGTFEDVTERAGVGGWGYGNGATFLDYDRDGRLDLLVGNYFADSLPDPRTGKHGALEPVGSGDDARHAQHVHATPTTAGATLLYHNRGDGTFEEVARSLGLVFHGWTLAVGSPPTSTTTAGPISTSPTTSAPTSCTSNTGATEPSAALPSRGRHRRDIPASATTGGRGMNVDFGDVDGNGYLDIYVTNILARRYKTDEGNMLWLNVADPAAPGGRRFCERGPGKRRRRRRLGLGSQVPRRQRRRPARHRSTQRLRHRRRRAHLLVRAPGDGDPDQEQRRRRCRLAA